MYKKNKKTNLTQNMSKQNVQCYTEVLSFFLVVNHRHDERIFKKSKSIRYSQCSEIIQTKSGSDLWNGGKILPITFDSRTYGASVQVVSMCNITIEVHLNL